MTRQIQKGRSNAGMSKYQFDLVRKAVKRRKVRLGKANQVNRARTKLQSPSDAVHTGFELRMGSMQSGTAGSGVREVEVQTMIPER
jgi:hypothetical protein